jgi:predicted ATP-dependent serine protease
MALNGHNLLIIGYPETGKSFTVVHIAEQLQKQARYFVLTATTGKAAQALQEKLPKCLNKVVIYLETRYLAKIQTSNGKTPRVPNFRFFNRWRCYFHFGSMALCTRANS